MAPLPTVAIDLAQLFVKAGKNLDEGCVSAWQTEEKATPRLTNTNPKHATPHLNMEDNTL